MPFKPTVIRNLLLLILLLEVIVLVEWHYGWSMIWYRERLETVNHAILRDSSNLSLYRDRMELVDKILVSGANDPSLDSVFYSDLQRRIALGERDADLFMIRFLYHSERKEYLRMVQDLSSAIEYGKEVHSLRAAAYEKQGEYDSAITDYRRIMFRDPSLDYHSRIALLSVLRGRYNEAIEELRRSAWDIRTLGELLLLTGRIDDAITCLERKPEGNDDLLAMAYYRKGGRGKALSLFERAVRQDSTDLVLEFCISKVHAETGRTEPALTHLIEAFQRGFVYFELLRSDRSFAALAQEPMFRERVRYYQQKNGPMQQRWKKVIAGAGDSLKAIIGQKDLHRMITAKRRLLLLYPNTQEEYRKLVFADDVAKEWGL